MIDFIYQNDFSLSNEKGYEKWLFDFAFAKAYTIKSIEFVFMSDEELLAVNRQFLDHDYYTDIITFDDTMDNSIAGQILISTDRVTDNAKGFNVTFDHELKRVMAHGFLHMMEYNDKDEAESLVMRAEEDKAIAMFHVEQ